MQLEKTDGSLALVANGQSSRPRMTDDPEVTEQGCILICEDGSVLTIWEQGGKILSKPYAGKIQYA